LISQHKIFIQSNDNKNIQTWDWLNKTKEKKILCKTTHIRNIIQNIFFIFKNIFDLNKKIKKYL